MKDIKVYNQADLLDVVKAQLAAQGKRIVPGTFAWTIRPESNDGPNHSAASVGLSVQVENIPKRSGYDVEARKRK